MLIIENVFIVLYGLSLLFIAFFSLGQGALIIALIIKRKKNTCTRRDDQPYITVQLPIYNEGRMVQPLLQAVMALDYPAGRLEIQILDDSTDGTTDIIESIIRHPGFGNHQINHIKREVRDGYKAGALQNGLNGAAGEFIAVFDADFLPEPDFLLRMISHFADERIGMVQARWGHLNPNRSWLTRVQAIALNGHFLIDQQARSNQDCFINFNGTAGIWRKDCIMDAGGWQADTLTEDLDLSYRAQLKGWKFEYCEDIVVPAELPELLSSFRTQQFRWIKGGVETSIKILPPLWRSDHGLRVKLFGTFHLLSSYTYLFVLLSSILSLPALIIKSQSSRFDSFFALSYMLVFVILIHISYFCMALMRNSERKNILSQLALAFSYSTLLVLGLSVQHSRAVWQGIIGQKSPFFRTPKRFERPSSAPNSNSAFGIKTYAAVQPLTAEIVLAVYFLVAIVIGVILNDYTFMSYHVLMVAGFLTVIRINYKESRQQLISPALS